MKKRWYACGLGALGLFVLPTLVFARGYGLNEIGTKALGMGGAFAAQADDPTAVYFNPAGIVQLEGTQVSVGVNTVTPSVTFESNGTSGIPVGGQPSFAGQETDTEDETFFIPNVYFTHKFSDKVSAGLGAFSNFGLSTDWKDDWEGRFILGGQLAEIKTYSVNPVIAYRPHERVSLAFGAVAQRFEIEVQYNQFVPIPPALGGPAGGEVHTKLKGDNWNWGWNVALLVWLTDNLRVGATYRSEISHTIKDGDAEFSPTVPAIAPIAPIPGVFPGFPGFPGIQDTGFSGSITTPAIAYLAVAYTWNRFTFEFDAQWTEWSTFDKLKATFEQPVAGQPSLETEIGWENTWAYRFGVQYKTTEWLDLRAGFVYDEETMPDDELSVVLPSSNRQLYTFGASGHYKSLTVDFAYNYLVDDDRKWNNAKGDPSAALARAGYKRITGEFNDKDAHIFGLNLTYRF